MTDKQLTILTDPPAAYIAGSGDDFAVVKTSTVVKAADMAQEAYLIADQLATNKGNDIVEIKRALLKLSDALSLLAGETANVTLGVKHGRITHDDE